MKFPYTCSRELAGEIAQCIFANGLTEDEAEAYIAGILDEIGYGSLRRSFRYLAGILPRRCK